MSYLFPDGSTTELGVLQVGSNIDVDGNSVISIPQSVETTADLTFNSVTTTQDIEVGNDLGVNNNITALGEISGGTVTDNGNRVITSVTPTAGTAISVTSLTSSGPAAAFTINNTGVTSLIAGTNISISSATGNITITASSSPQIETIGVPSDYTALLTDEYIGVTANPTTITLPTGVNGNNYIIKNESATGVTTVTGTGGETIDGSVTKSLAKNASISVVFRAGTWRII